MRRERDNRLFATDAHANGESLRGVFGDVCCGGHGGISYGLNSKLRGQVCQV
jgi:hypothetical protein